MTWPTMLLGVEAPAVNPMTSGPAGSQSHETSSSTDDVEGRPIGRWRISAADTRQLGSAMWNVVTRPAQILARLQVLLLLYPPITTASVSGSASRSASTASCRSCVAL